MRSESVVAGSIGFKDSAQVVFAQDHQVVQALPTDRTDQPLRMVHITREHAMEHHVDIKLRVGINSGPVVAGVIGKSK
jgi:class 3 adenylate cyclase